MQPFADHFSPQAEQYAQYRPGYPAALFEFLLSQTPGRDHAWDCATGNGQVASELADQFQRVTATDASTAQISHALPNPKIEYRVAVAEDSGLPDHCIDLLTVATAIHWFDLERFYGEVRRVLRPDGMLAVWTYSLRLPLTLRIGRP